MELTESGLFADVRAHRFDFRAEYPVPRWLGLVRTFSPVRRLPGPRLEAFLGALAEAVHARGGVVAYRLDPVLALGRRPA